MASLVHSNSAEIVTSQLDLYAVPATQTALEEGQYTEYRYVSVLTNGIATVFCSIVPKYIWIF